MAENRVKIFFWGTVQERMNVKRVALDRGEEKYTEELRRGWELYSRIPADSLELAGKIGRALEVANEDDRARLELEVARILKLRGKE